MRDTLSDELVRLGKKDVRILLLTGDHGYSLFDDFRRECPAQYINAGIAEQNMVGVAAGLARSGFRPIVYGLSAFVYLLAMELVLFIVILGRAINLLKISRVVVSSLTCQSTLQPIDMN